MARKLDQPKLWAGRLDVKRASQIIACVMLPIVLCVGSAASPTAVLAAGANPPSLEDDAYHFPEFEDGAHDTGCRG